MYHIYHILSYKYGYGSGTPHNYLTIPMAIFLGTAKHVPELPCHAHREEISGAKPSSTAAELLCAGNAPPDTGGLPLNPAEVEGHCKIGKDPINETS